MTLAGDTGLVAACRRHVHDCCLLVTHRCPANGDPQGMMQTETSEEQGRLVEVCGPVPTPKASPSLLSPCAPHIGCAPRISCSSHPLLRLRRQLTASSCSLHRSTIWRPGFARPMLPLTNLSKRAVRPPALLREARQVGSIGLTCLLRSRRVTYQDGLSTRPLQSSTPCEASRIRIGQGRGSSGRSLTIVCTAIHSDAQHLSWVLHQRSNPVDSWTSHTCTTCTRMHRVLLHVPRLAGTYTVLPFVALAPRAECWTTG